MKLLKYKLAIIAGGICLGLIGATVKLMGSEMHPISMNFMRMLIATLTMAAIVPFIEKDFLIVSKKELKDYAVVGVLMAVTFSLYVTANVLAPVNNVVLISSTYVIFAAIISFLLLKENITTYHLIAIVAAIAGIAILNPFTGIKAIGNYLAVGQAIGFAAMMTYMRKVEKALQLKSIFWFFLFSTIALAPFAAYFGLANLLPIMNYIILMGVVSTGLAYLLMSYGLQKTQTETAAILNLTTFATATILFAVLLVGETLSKNTLFAAALLVAAGIMANKRCSKKHFMCV